MKRILYVEANEDGTVGGSHKIQYDLVTRLSSDFEPLVLHYQDNIWSSRFREQGIEVLTWDDFRGLENGRLSGADRIRRWSLHAGAVRKRFQLLKKLRVDLVHLNNSPFVGYQDWLPAAKFAGIPCVTYAMGDASREPRASRRFALREFSAYFPLSRYIEESLHSNGISPSRIVLTYPGVDLEALDRLNLRPRNEIRAEFGLGAEQLLVVMVGNIRHWKGQHVVIDALGSLPSDTLANLKILFVGEGATGEHAEYRKCLDQATEQAGLNDAIVFTGRREDVPDLLEAADIAIHASIIPEPFGLVVQEAMFHGCAVIAAAAGGPVEMLDEHSGLMFDTADPAQLTHHLTCLARDDEFRKRLSENARIKARQFGVRRHVELIEARYRHLLSR